MDGIGQLHPTCFESPEPHDDKHQEEGEQGLHGDEK